jgi:hypothetical protein
MTNFLLLEDDPKLIPHDAVASDAVSNIVGSRFAALTTVKAL